MDTSWLPYIIFLIASALSLLAFVFKSIALLRIFTVASSLLFVIYYYVFQPEPLWMDVLSEGVTVGINAVMLLILAIQERKIQFTEEEKEIYQGIFSRLTPFEFFKLIKQAHWKNYEKGDVLIRKDQHAGSIYLIYNGEVRVYLDENREVQLRDGAFIGELSFSLARPANADVVVQTHTRLLYWGQVELRGLLERNPAMKEHFNAIITTDLAKKLAG
jgi:hypothetical protein